MSLPYPLYDMLLEKVTQRTEKGIDLKKVCATIKKIGETSTSDETCEHYREINALVIHHEALENGCIADTPPCGGKLMPGNMGLLYNMLNFPPMLQQIIAQYVEEMAQ